MNVITELTADQARERFDKLTPASCADNLFRYDNGRAIDTSEPDALEGVERVEILDTGLKGWAGECFVRVNHGGGFGWTAFASLRAEVESKQ